MTQKIAVIYDDDAVINEDDIDFYEGIERPTLNKGREKRAAEKLASKGYTVQFVNQEHSEELLSYIATGNPEFIPESARNPELEPGRPSLVVTSFMDHATPTGFDVLRAAARKHIPGVMYAQHIPEYGVSAADIEQFNAARAAEEPKAGYYFYENEFDPNAFIRVVHSTLVAAQSKSPGNPAPVAKSADVQVSTTRIEGQGSGPVT